MYFTVDEEPEKKIKVNKNKLKEHLRRKNQEKITKLLKQKMWKKLKGIVWLLWYESRYFGYFQLYCLDNDDIMKYVVKLIDGLRTSKVNKLFRDGKDMLHEL